MSVADAALALAVAALYAGPLTSLLETWRGAGQAWAPLWALLAAAGIAAVRLRAAARGGGGAAGDGDGGGDGGGDGAARGPTQGRPRPGAAAVVLGGALLLRMLASATGEAALAWLSLPAAALGLAGLALGPGAVARLWPAALALGAAVPPPAPAHFEVLLGLKAAAARVATALVSACGVHATLDGFVIRVGAAGEVRVLDACSGVRLQAAVLAVAVVLVLARAASPAFRRAALLACVPAAFLATVLRIALVTAARATYPGPSIEALHDASGVLVVLPAVLLMVAAGRAAETLEAARREAEAARAA